MSFETVIAGALATVKSAAGVGVTYRRGLADVALTAVKSEVRLELAPAGGTVMEVEATEWLIMAADLVLSGSAATPAEGDQVVQLIGSSTYVYEVMPVASEGHYRPADPYGQGWHVRSRLISVT